MCVKLNDQNSIYKILFKAVKGFGTDTYLLRDYHSFMLKFKKLNLNT